MSSQQDLPSNQTTSTTHPQHQSVSLPPTTFNDVTEGQTAEQPLSTQITSDHSPKTPPRSAYLPATGPLSTPMACKMSSNRSFSKHLASDVDQFLKEELDGMIVTADVQGFLQFALPDLKGPDSWDSPEWKKFTDGIAADEEQRGLQQQWIAAKPELQKYKPFCAWVDNLLTSIGSFIRSPTCNLFPRREIHFTSLGSTNIRCTPGYADGEKVDGTETIFRPDAACVMKDVTRLDHWWPILVPVEFKRRKDARRSMRAGPSTSTGPGVSRVSKRSHPEAFTSGSDLNKFRRVGPTSSSSSRQPSSRSSQPSSSQPPFSQPPFSQPSSSRGPPTSKQPDHSTIESCPNNIIRCEALSHRFKPTVGSPTPATPCTQSVYKATKDDIQLARYAMETLAAVGDRTHVFGLAVNSNNDNDNDNDNKPDHTIALWCFDRCGAIRSPPLNVNHPEGLGAFIKFLAAIVCMENDALGFNHFFANAGCDKPVPDLCNMSVLDNQGRSLKLCKVLDRRTGIVGRATLVHHAELLEKSSPEGVISVVLKSSWQHRNRDPEWAILKELHEDDKAENIVVCHGGWEQEDTGGNWRRAKFGLTNAAVHDRALRHTVFEYLHPITRLSQPFHVPHIGWSILNAIGFLNQKKWFHRDISTGNMGFEILECGGVVVKLHDFDLSKRHNSPQDNPHWTGTLPFVAIGLLECPDAKHRIGFDVEALIWNLLWIVQIHGDKTSVDIANHPLKRWFDDPTDLDKLADSKRGYLRNPRGEALTNLFYGDLEDDMLELAAKWRGKLDNQAEERLQQRLDAKSRVRQQLEASPTQELSANDPAYQAEVEVRIRKMLEERVDAGEKVA
ncbi:hypothetical protein FRC04_006615 [Tulasnella sp. 424]|nr:hypothetical protein FRC04_006615 [Tulasnella sp. 424]